MRAATLRIPIRLVRRVPTKDDAGSSTYSDVVFADLRARQLSKREAEQWIGHQLETIGTIVYEVRYLAGITTEMEVIQGSNRMRVKRVEDPDEGRKRRLLITCEQR